MPYFMTGSDYCCYCDKCDEECDYEIYRDIISWYCSDCDIEYERWLMISDLDDSMFLSESETE